MSRLEDGREVICTLALPLPLDAVGAVGSGLAVALKAAGWTDVVVLTDGTNRVVATPPSGLSGGAS